MNNKTKQSHETKPDNVCSISERKIQKNENCLWNSDITSEVQVTQVSIIPAMLQNQDDIVEATDAGKMFVLQSISLTYFIF